MSFPKYPAYKDSGVEWLGEVPEHWKEKPFFSLVGERCESNAGMKQENLLSLSYGRIVNKDINSLDGLLPASFETYQVVHPGDIVFRLTDLQNDKRSLRSAIVRETGILTSAYLAGVCRGIFPEFASFLFRAYDSIKVFYSMGGGLRQSMKYSDMKWLPIFLPEWQEQTQIARFLDHETARIDALIEEQQRLIELLKEKRQAVISHAVTKGLDPTVPMKDSGVEWLGEVPAHWRAVRLRHCLVDALTYGANEPSDEANLEHPRYIRITDLNDDGTLSAETYKSLPPEKAEPYMLEEGDVLFARSGATVGKSFLYSREYGPACYAGYLIRARVNKRALIPMYLWMCTQSRQYEQFIGESNIQATIQNVSAEKYGNMWIALPEIEEQEKILAELEIQLSQFKSLMETSVGALVLLQERRSALISAAVTGKIDVRGWQQPTSAQTTELEKEAV